MPDSRSYTVYYGAGGIYVIRTGVTGNVACTNAVFGDPLPGTGKRCYRKAESAAPANALPVVSLTAPANNASYTQGAVIAFAASASDTDGTVARVDLFDNGTLIGTDSTAPFNWTWSGAVVGKHVFTAKATDNLGAAVTSVGINVNVNAPSSAPPSGAIKCANQNSTCTLPSGKTATVWYGARTSYRVLTGKSGSLACNNSTFGGDPIWYVRKACYYVSN
jgi:Bacterial Ig domain